MSDYVAKTFRERPARGELTTLYNASGEPCAVVPPPQAQPVGRAYGDALMGPTNEKANIVFQLWSDGTVTWRDG